MNSATKRLINFPVVFFLRPPAEGESESSRVSSSGPHGRRLESLHERVKAFLLFVMEWEEREPREAAAVATRSEEHTSELQSRLHLVCRLLLEKKKIQSH